MKKQNLNEDALFNMYGILGELLSLNHTCIRIANQDVPIFANKTVLSKEEIFKHIETYTDIMKGKKDPNDPENLFDIKFIPAQRA